MTHRADARHTVLVVDDHELFASALSMSLDSYQISAFGLVPASVDDILRQAGALTPGLVVLDLDLGPSVTGDPMRGSEAIVALRELGWEVLVVTAGPDTPEAAAAVAAGAAGVLPKTTSFTNLLDTVVRLVSGERVMTEVERATWLARDRESRGREEARTRMFSLLTVREREVLELLAKGYRAAAIADRSVVSVGTVRAQIKSIRAKLGVSSQLEAAALLRLTTDDAQRPPPGD